MTTGTNGALSCVDAGSMRVGTVLVQAACNKGPSQRFSFVPYGESLTRGLAVAVVLPQVDAWAGAQRRRRCRAFS